MKKVSFKNILYLLYKKIIIKLPFKKNFLFVANSNQHNRFFLLLDFFELNFGHDLIITSKIKSKYKNYLPITVPSYDHLGDENFVASSWILDLHRLKNIILIYDLSIEAITFQHQTSDLLLNFHNILKKYNFDPKRVILLNANRNSSQYYQEWADKFSTDFRITVIGYNFYLFDYHIEVIKNKNIIKNYKSNLKNLNSIENKKHFISLNLRPRWHRKALLLFLLSENLLSKGTVTYFGERFGNSDGFTIDSANQAAQKISLLKNGEKMLAHVENLDKISPIIFERDSDNLTKALWVRKPGEIEFLIPELHVFGSFKEPISYFEIVAETWFTDEKCLFLTEKTIRPILRLNPFVLLASPHSLSYLKSVGFKTFSPYIDESYDNIESPTERMEAIFKEIKRLCAMNEEELKIFYHNLAPVLHHNFNHFIKKMPQVFKEEMKEKILNNLLKI